VTLLMRRLRASPRSTAALGGLVLAGFVLIARPSPSVLRAAARTGGAPWVCQVTHHRLIRSLSKLLE